MPRTLDADLLAAMNSGVFTPYFKIELMDSNRTTVLWSTTDVTAFELEGLKLTVSFHDPTWRDDWITFRLKRGIIVDGSPNVITTSGFYPSVDRHEKRIRTLEGHVFPEEYFSTPGDVTYHEIINTVCTHFHYTHQFEDPAAAWLDYQFLPAGRTLVLNNARHFFTMLRQKHLVFATDYGGNALYFFQAKQTGPAYPAGYTVITAGTLAAPGHGAFKEKYLFSRDEAETVHFSGTANMPLHNLGYLESTDSHPDRTWWIDTQEWIIKDIPPNLKYRDFDAITIEKDVVEQNIWPAQFVEVFNKKLNPSWQWYAKFLPIFGNTEGGQVPSTIEASAPYTPLNTSTFDNNLDATTNNLQALAEAVDEFDFTMGSGVVGRLAEFVGDARTLQAANVIGPAANVLTLTSTAASTLALNVTVSKTLTLTSTDDFTLTIPATGTAALLATANVFTTQQMVDGTSDQIQFRVQGVNGQTAYLQTWETFTPTTVAAIDNSGHIGIGGVPLANSALTLQETFTIGAATGETYGAYVRPSFYATIDQTTGVQYGLTFVAQSHASSSKNYYGLLGIQGVTGHRGSGTLSIGKGLDVQFGTYSGSGAVTTFYGAYLAEFKLGGAITTEYALYIAAIDGATTNYAIYTNAGSIVFNAAGDAATDFTLKSDSYNALFMDASNESIVIMSNAAGKVGFFGATAVAQATELTDEFTTITFTAPGTPDYAIQDLTNSSPYGFVTKDEGNSVLKVIANLQTRVNELETKLTAYGLLVDAD